MIRELFFEFLFRINSVLEFKRLIKFQFCILCQLQAFLLQENKLQAKNYLFVNSWQIHNLMHNFESNHK